MSKKLRSGYTTGACASAAARAACTAVLLQKDFSRIEVRFPNNTIVPFTVSINILGENSATASIIKDAGDDPDVTNGALITADVTVHKLNIPDTCIEVVGGIGVGVVTKPGLAVDVGSPAINPVPMNMIKTNVREALEKYGDNQSYRVQVCVNVPDGIELAKKTLNARLGIIGGISILGTTGIVRPISAKAWTATIQASMDVARANGIQEIILSTGRTSERCIQQELDPEEEALVMMGDYLHFALKEVKRYSFTRIHMATMWAKLLKGVMGHEQTHVRHGILDTSCVCKFLEEIGVEQSIVSQLTSTNTAREILEILLLNNGYNVIEAICEIGAREYKQISGVETVIHLVDGRGNLICSKGI